MSIQLRLFLFLLLSAMCLSPSTWADSHSATQVTDSEAREVGLYSDVDWLTLRNLSQDDYGEVFNLTEFIDNDYETVREVVTSSGLNAVRNGDVVYLYNNQIIFRYNLSTQVWLPNLPMPDPVTAFEVDDAGIYVAHGREVYRYNLDGSNRQFIRNANSDVLELGLLGNYLIYRDSTTYRSLDKLTGTLIDSASFFYDLIGFSSFPARNRLIGRTTGVSPSDIVYIETDGTGQFSTQVDSIYHGDYPGATRTYAFPDGSRVVDGAGIVYHAADLTYAGSLAGQLDHLDFYGDLPIVLRDDTLIAYNNVLVETGQYTPAMTPDTFFIYKNDVVSFRYTADSVEVNHIDINLLSPAQPGEPIDPIGLAYTPDQILYDGDNRLYILSRQHLSIFVYDTVVQAYQPTIPLLEAPLYIAFSAVNQRLYTAYSSGQIKVIDPVDPIEMGLFNSPQTPCGLATAGEYIFVCDPSGAWVSHFTYSAAGQLISQVDFNYFSRVYEWSAVNQRMYHFRDDASPNDLLWEIIDEQGVLGQQMDSPFHGGVWGPPLCVNPDGSTVIIGSGRIFDAITLNEINSLSNNIQSCTWLDGTLYTFSGESTGSELQEWSAVYQRNTVDTLPGTPLALFAQSGSRLILVRDVNGVPVVTFLVPPIFSDGFE